MICENCSSEHLGKYGSGRFCSQTCARGFSTKKDRANINKKVSDALSGISLSETHPNARGKKTGKSHSPETKKKMSEALMAKALEKLIDADFSSLKGNRSRKSKILYEQGYKCLACGIGQEWNGKPLAFQLDHVNGNKHDNSRENLRCLCPNCHSQTETFCGRNVGNYVLV